MRTYCGIMHHDQYIRIFRELVEHRGEVIEFHLEGVELFTDARTCVFECLDKLRGAFVPRRGELVRIGVLLDTRVWY